MQLQPFIGLLFDIYFYKAGIFFQISALSLFYCLFRVTWHLKNCFPPKVSYPASRVSFDRRRLCSQGKSFRARNITKSASLIFSGNIQVYCFPREQSRSVQNSPLSLQEHYSICLLRLVHCRVFFLLPVPKSAREMGNGQEVPWVPEDFQARCFAIFQKEKTPF